MYQIQSLSPEQHDLLNAGKVLPVMEEFYTIQGEGFNSGRAAYFIRIGGCDVGCHWCDVKESWDASLHPLTAVDEVIERAASYPAKAVVITGGEPLQYHLSYLTEGLKQRGVATFLETSGAYPMSGAWDWICLSPKKTMPPCPENFSLAHELKVIVFNNHDFTWAADNARHVSDSCLLYLQPEWSKREQITPALVEFIKNNPRWRSSIQTHKYMHIQ